MNNLKPKDIIAAIIITGIFGLILFKSNHSLDAILTLIIGYYFGHRISHIDTGK